MSNLVTCHLIFEVGIERSEVEKLVAENSDGKGVVHHFYPDRKRGLKQITFAVVEVPSGADEALKQVPEVIDVDYMQDFVGVGLPTSCDGGGCAPGG